VTIPLFKGKPGKAWTKPLHSSELSYHHEPSALHSRDLCVNGVAKPCCSRDNQIKDGLQFGW